ncbi:hypothetical protein [Streptomyces sp. SS1-1]|uniref:hypothetical protein n=1 Tax=Streptomyces sp. SS1-1 TaxID=2651869 RepID=UPI00178C7E01|nr:hypothetical protein [Streptomyces sp. SS1-1]
MNKPTLLLATAAGLLAAIVAASWFPTHPGLAALLGYTVVVGSLASGTGAPVARTIGASVLVIAMALTLTLHAVRKLIDLALWILGTSTQGALHAAKAHS